MNGKKVVLFLSIISGLLVIMLMIALSIYKEEPNVHFELEDNFGPLEDEKMIGFISEINKDKKEVLIDISEWKKRQIEGPHDDKGYSYVAKLADDTVIKMDNGPEVSIEELEKWQVVVIFPATEEEYEGSPMEIIILNKQ